MKYSNQIKKDYVNNKENLKESFPEAYDFLIQIENLYSKGFHVGTYLNLNLYYKTKFILHFMFGFDAADISICGKPNGTLKRGVVDDSAPFFNFFIPKLAAFKIDLSDTLDTFDDDDFYFSINKTEKSAFFSKFF